MNTEATYDMHELMSSGRALFERAALELNPPDVEDWVTARPITLGGAGIYNLIEDVEGCRILAPSLDSIRRSVDYETLREKYTSIFESAIRDNVDLIDLATLLLDMLLDGYMTIPSRQGFEGFTSENLPFAMTKVAALAEAYASSAGVPQEGRDDIQWYFIAHNGTFTPFQNGGLTLTLELWWFFGNRRYPADYAPARKRPANVPQARPLVQRVTGPSSRSKRRAKFKRQGK